MKTEHVFTTVVVIPVQVESLLSYCMTIPGESMCRIWHCDQGYQIYHLQSLASFVPPFPPRGHSDADSKHD